MKQPHRARSWWPGVAAVVLVLLGGTTWMSGGFWAPDGAYSRLLSPLICLFRSRY